MNYRTIRLSNFKKLPQVQKYLTADQQFDIEVVARVFPFKTNNYVVDELINWENVPNDPLFRLTFPQKEMLQPEQFAEVAKALKNDLSREEMDEVVRNIRLQLNPHPAGQQSNVPQLESGTELAGMQHKYRETALFFPRSGQTCHAYCTFCFRWPQFTNLNALKFAMKEAGEVVKYFEENPELTDLLITGGDPMIMAPEVFARYLEVILENRPDNLKNIRIGTKSLSFWPYKYTTDPQAGQMLELLSRIPKAGMHLAIMAHFSHPVELKTKAVREAVQALRNIGAEIRTQSPLLSKINDHPGIWSEMWREQVRQGMIPYYLFVVRDTGAQHYFGVTLNRAWQIFSQAARKVSGLSRTVRGPSMSAYPGKVEVLGVTEVNGEKVFALRFLQSRNPEWSYKPFFAKFDERAAWLDDLEPSFGADKFFFEEVSTKSVTLN